MIISYSLNLFNILEKRKYKHKQNAKTERTEISTPIPNPNIKTTSEISVISIMARRPIFFHLLGSWEGELQSRPTEILSLKIIVARHIQGNMRFW